MPEQSIRFTSHAGRKIAWAAVGEGPPVVIGGWWMSHLELDWRNQAFRAFVAALARYRTVIRYDRPGTGLSADDGPPPARVDHEVDVLAAVIDELDVDGLGLFGGSSGGPPAAAYAAANPERVERLVLYGSYARGAKIADEAARESLLALVRSHWGLGSRVLADVFMPSAQAKERDRFAAFQRESASSEAAALSLEAAYSFDVADRLDAVVAPTAVLHRRDDRAIPFALGQDLAARIRRATFRGLDGADHLPWHGAAGELLRAILVGFDVDDPEVELDVDASAPAQAKTELSEREIEVLRLVALGLSDREIGERLVLSPHTVHRHVANVRTKLRLPSRAAAAAHAARLGVI